MTNDPNVPSDRVQLALEELGRLTLREHSMETVLQRVVDLTKKVMPGTPEVSITMVGNGKATTPASTGRLAVDCDESQYAHGAGPCLHAATSGELVEIADMEAEARWTGFVQEAAERGALSSLSLPLRLDDGVCAALNIYARAPHAFDADSRATAGWFAPHAAAAVGNMHAYEDARNMADNLQRALESRAVIDLAKGILMERHKLTADQAFQVLVQASMGVNRKLRDVAQHLVSTGELIAPRTRHRRREPR
jgi:GAF domain-containing protein